MSVVNALSEWTKVEVKREGKLWVQEYKRGKPQGQVKPIGKATDTGTTVIFKADHEMYRSRTYNSARLPALINYENAKAHYENAVPIRGRYPEERPLGKNRRYSWMQIHKRVRSIEEEGNPVGKFITTYACQLYQTDCVEFFPDESVVLRVNNWRGS